MNHKAISGVKTAAGLALIAAGLAYFMYLSMRSSWSYYYSVDDFMADPAASSAASLRLAGSVKAGSVGRDAASMTLTFTLAGSASELDVEYKGAVPGNFSEGREVVVEGRLGDDGVFLADLLMTRCESKYKSRLR
jgi:cytochrome c-type biogenesis protein CcmE